MDAGLLITEIKQGSTAAQKCFFDLYADKMLMLCRRYLKSREDAEETMLDGFCRFFKKINSFTNKGEGAAEAWLRQIMINECLMVLRKKMHFRSSQNQLRKIFRLQKKHSAGYLPQRSLILLYSFRWVTERYLTFM